jgi:murein DD-endopeptidase MepM/ murein hydrolase activator NlpD
MATIQAAVRKSWLPVLLLLSLSLVAGSWPPDPRPDQDLPEPLPMGAVQWLQVLPAPHTPAGYEPGPGPRIQWPLRGVQTQPFGCTGFYREGPTQACPGGFHTGIDIARDEGVPIVAAAPGLAYPIPDQERYGNHVLIQHRGGLSTLYAHMVAMKVAWGQPVRAGDLIGWVGSTGNSTGPHLHFEVRYAGVPFDPIPYLEGSPADPYPLPEGWPGAPPNGSRGRR